MLTRSAFSRRDLLRLGLGLGATLALGSACSSAGQAPAATSAPKPAAPAAGPTQAAAPAAPAAPTAAAQKPAGPAPEQRLTIGIGTLPKSLDPNLDTSQTANVVYGLLYDSLVRLDEKGNPTPGLAESWKTLDDKTWQFKLRKGVKFHNGELLTAEAARMTLERVRDPKTKSQWAGRFTLLDRVDVVDEQTLNVVTKEPWATLIKIVFLAPILPPKYLADKGDAGFAEAPVGTGPFKFKEWKQDSVVTVEANPDYWDGAPKLKAITVRAYPEDSTLVAAAEKGEIDLAYNVPPSDADRLKGKGLSIVSRNLSQSLVFPMRTTVGGPLANKDVRQALNYAIDKQAIVDKLLGGYGRVLDGQIVGPEAFGYNANLKPYPYDPARAKQLLAQAGFGGGFSVKFSGAVGRWLKDKEICEAISTMLADVGVKAELEILESAVWLDQFNKGTSGPLLINGSTWGPLLDPEQAMAVYTTASQRNVIYSQEYDNLFRKTQTTIDSAERQKALGELTAWFREEAPMIFLLQLPSVNAVSKKVAGADFTAYYALKNPGAVAIQ